MGTPYQLNRRGLLLSAAAGAASMAVGSASAARLKDRVVLIMGSGGPLTSWAPSYVAEAMGYYKDEGLTVERIYSNNGPTGMAALLSGSGDVFYTAPGELLIAASQGQKLKIITAQSNVLPLNVVFSKDYAAKHNLKEDMPLDQKIAAGKTCKGIRLGITVPASLTDSCGRLLLKELSIDAQTEAQVIPLQSVENMTGGLASGRIDAMVSPAPGSSLAVTKLDGVNVFSAARGEIAGLSEAGGHVSEVRADRLEQDPELFEAIVRADVRAMRYIIENPKDAGEKFYQAQFASSIGRDLWPLVWDSDLGQFKTPYVKTSSLQQWFTLKMVPSTSNPDTVKFSEIVDMRLVDAAVKKIGWNIAP